MTPSASPANRTQRSSDASRAIDDEYAEIAGSGLFDAAFYSSTYRGLVGDADPLQHFLTMGTDKGYLPSPNFDPLIYRLTARECDGTNPLLHHLRHSQKWRLWKRRLPSVDTLFPDLLSDFRKHQGGKRTAPANEDDVRVYLAHLDRIDLPRETSIKAVGTEFKLRVPPPDFFFDRLRIDQPFAFARLPHGYWDALVLREQVAADPRLASLTLDQRHTMACRIALAAQPHKGPFAEGFFDEIENLIGQHGDSKCFFESIGFKGYPTPDESPFKSRDDEEHRQRQCDLLAQTFRSGKEFIDGTFWKRLVFSGRIKQLPELCRDRHVVLVGAEWFGDLNKRWRLPRFTHIQIPPRLSHLIRWDVFDRAHSAISNAVREKGPRPVVLTQCGGSLAYWLISRMFSTHPECFYIDLGQALNVWFTDNASVPVFSWMALYREVEHHLNRDDFGPRSKV